MKKLLAFSILLICLTLTGFSQGRSGKYVVRLRGWVAAYDSFVSLRNISSAPSLDLLVLEIHPNSKWKGRSKFLKLHYESFSSSKSIQKFTENPNRLWKVTLRRDNTCDDSISRMQSKKVMDSEGQSVQLNSWVFLRSVPEDVQGEVLECYRVVKIK